MIALETEKLIIATPAGTEADRLHRELCNRHKVYWIPQRNETGGFDDYGVVIPDQWKDFDRAVLVRNPYTRLLALRENVNNRRLMVGKPPLSLGEYVDKVPIMQTPTVSGWAASLEPYKIIHFESIEKDIRRITGLRIRCPVEHLENWRRKFEKLKPERLTYLYQYFIHDIVKHGYTKKAITPIEAAALRGNE